MFVFSQCTSHSDSSLIPFHGLAGDNEHHSTYGLNTIGSGSSLENSDSSASVSQTQSPDDSASSTGDGTTN